MRRIARALRHPWRTLKRAVHYVADRPPVAVAVTLGATVVAMGSLTLSVWFHGQDEARFEAQKTAREVVASTIVPPLCKVIYQQAHPVDGTKITPRVVQNEDAWRGLGVVIGCPSGTK